MNREQNDIDISILCCTYNHEHFIRAALDGLVNQVTDASIEVIVADDASTDNTQSIIREYCENYPDLFSKCILRQSNVGIGKNCYEALSLAEGRYLAICDGDDVWIDSSKLQRQFEFLQENPEYTVCCTSLEQRIINGKKIKDSVSYVNDNIKTSWKIKEYYEFEDLLYCRFVSSCTTMLRWNLKGRVPEWLQNYRIIDYSLLLLHSAYGHIHVMNDFVSARYSVHNKGLTQQRNYDSFKETTKIINEVNKHLGFIMEEQIQGYFASREYRVKNHLIPVDATLRTRIIVRLASSSFLRKAYSLYRRTAPAPLVRMTSKILDGMLKYN